MHIVPINGSAETANLIFLPWLPVLYSCGVCQVPAGPTGFTRSYQEATGAGLVGHIYCEFYRCVLQLLFNTKVVWMVEVSQKRPPASIPGFATVYCTNSVIVVINHSLLDFIETKLAEMYFINNLQTESEKNNASGCKLRDDILLYIFFLLI